MDHISAIRAFTQVAKRQSFAAAAKDLNTAASVVSRYVKELEKDLGVRLLSRTTRKVSLTEAGQSYLHRALALLDDFDRLRDSTQALHSEPAGRLRVTLPLGLGQHLFAPLMPEFMQRCPKVSVSLNMTNQLVDMVAEGYDVAIRVLSQLEDSSLVARRLGSSGAVLCASADYAGEHGLPADLGELKDHSCVLFGDNVSNNWQFIDKTGNRTDVRVNGRLAVNSIEALRQTVLSGAGISVIPEFLVRQDLLNGALLPVLAEYELPSECFYVVYPQRQYVPMKVRCFIDYCVEKFV